MTMSSSSATPRATALSALSDGDLLDRVRRAKDFEAFAELFRRHRGAARRMAGRWGSGEAEAEDLVAEAFTRVLALLSRGGGPTEGFEPYLVRTIRNLAISGARTSGRVVAQETVADVPAPDSTEAKALQSVEQRLLAQAFKALPERLRIVLWHTTVCGETAPEVARKLDVTPSNVTTLAHRARERLRLAYLDAHMAAAKDVPEECAKARRGLAAYMRGTTGKPSTDSVAAHLVTCADCRDVHDQLRAVASRMRAVLLPALLLFGARELPSLIAIAPAAAPAAAPASGSAATGLAGPTKVLIAVAALVSTGAAALIIGPLLSGDEPAARNGAVVDRPIEVRQQPHGPDHQHPPHQGEKTTLGHLYPHAHSHAHGYSPSTSFAYSPVPVLLAFPVPRNGYDRPQAGPTDDARVTVPAQPRPRRRIESVPLPEPLPEPFPEPLPESGRERPDEAVPRHRGQPRPEPGKPSGNPAGELEKFGEDELAWKDGYVAELRALLKRIEDLDVLDEAFDTKIADFDGQVKALHARATSHVAERLKARVADLEKEYEALPAEARDSLRLALEAAQKAVSDDQLTKYRGRPVEFDRRYTAAVAAIRDLTEGTFAVHERG